MLIFISASATQKDKQLTSLEELDRATLHEAAVAEEDNKSEDGDTDDDEYQV